MSSTISVTNTSDYARTFGDLKPFFGVAGFSDQPALTIANVVKQFILAPPFAWRWNRNSTSITTVIGQQDYSVSLADFGWLEKATCELAGVSKELQVSLVLADELQQARPVNISTQLDDGAGNITFRLLPVPDQIYSIKAIYQKKATQITTLASNWTPIPDELQYIYTSGFIAYALNAAGDNRFESDLAVFLRQLIAANAGLQETEKNLFLASQIRDQRQAENDLLGARQGKQARGM